MIAKVHRGGQLLGVLLYNHNKVAKGQGEVLYAQKVIQPLQGSVGISEVSRSFAPYLYANIRTEKPILHISLNPDPNDKVSDETFVKLATDYMQQMGFGNQPFVVYKHSDIERKHIHIVSLGIDEEGKKIPDTFEKIRSMKVCRELETKYQLIPAITNDSLLTDDELLPLSKLVPLDYRQNDLKKQLIYMVKQLLKHYHFASLGAFNALLNQFNIAVEKVEGELQGVPKKGLVYVVLDENGNKASHPFKASKLGKTLSLPYIEKHLQKKQDHLKGQNTTSLKAHITFAKETAHSKSEFVQELKAKGIEVVFRENKEGRTYGVTFIDHNSRCVYNGSQLGKEFSANVFHQWLKSLEEPATALTSEVNMPAVTPYASKNHNNTNTVEEDTFSDTSWTHYQEDFGKDSALNAFFTLFSLDDQGVDYEEEDFTRRMKRATAKRRKMKNKS